MMQYTANKIHNTTQQMQIMQRVQSFTNTYVAQKLWPGSPHDQCAFRSATLQGTLQVESWAVSEGNPSWNIEYLYGRTFFRVLRKSYIANTLSEEYLGWFTHVPCTWPGTGSIAWKWSSCCQINSHCNLKSCAQIHLRCSDIFMGSEVIGIDNTCFKHPYV